MGKQEVTKGGVLATNHRKKTAKAPDYQGEMVFTHEELEEINRTGRVLLNAWLRRYPSGSSLVTLRVRIPALGEGMDKGPIKDVKDLDNQDDDIPWN